ncbi:small conductance mechanosensitive channel [Halanaerobium saccharolyticum]|uniref:Small conductance mechanosensitive channel n=1 Tax=Halanaerobium saccharolyticum TaxID=43595 RepID=A0A4R6LR86_9FIRM|nr:mechanosensitive ion channel domain-containing protein [Halanaerobium saccharolyticum]TDO87854.1 small conductance mechanosensitive channel [Halanaerobium saccharolyticum]
MNQITSGLQAIAADYGMKFLLAVVLLIVGLWVVKLIVNLLEKNIQGKFERTLTSFLMSITRAVLLIMLFISIASTIGIQVTSFIAVLGAASFAVGLALQGSLSNFAGGVLLLIFKPFTAGDTIEVAGHKGKVQEIQILYTIITTFDNKKIMIPNSNISNSSITNFSAMSERRVDLIFGIGYDDDFHQAISLLKDLADKHDLILDDPEPIIRVVEHAGSSINIACKVWVKGPDYWTVFYDMHEDVKDAFDEAGIGIPYPQLDLHFDEGTKLC